MANDKTGRLLGKIGQLLAEDTSYPLNGTLLYARVAANWVDPSIFKNRGNDIVFRWPNLNSLAAALLDLWGAEDADNRWTEIEYVIHDEKFDVKYTYAEEIEPAEDNIDRRERIVKRHFGDKPIVYPPLPPEDDEVPNYDL